MGKIQTKEQLIEEKAKLEKMNEHYVAQEKNLRQEFAKAFRWGNPKQNYYPSHSLKEWDWKTPTWEQIFVEVGKLKALMDYRDFEGNISELEYKLEDLEKRIKKEIHPNL